MGSIGKSSLVASSQPYPGCLFWLMRRLVVLSQWCANLRFREIHPQLAKDPGKISGWWWFGTWMDYSIFHNIWDVILPIDFHIFQRGWNHQPESTRVMFFCLKTSMEKPHLSMGESPFLHLRLEYFGGIQRCTLFSDKPIWEKCR